MFDKLESRGIGLCLGIVAAIVFAGRIFGGSLWGLLPLAFGVASGVWLWIQELIRSGREMEWSSEQIRGQMVSFRSPLEYQGLHATLSGYCEPPT
jgi:hypothetical protein